MIQHKRIIRDKTWKVIGNVKRRTIQSEEWRDEIIFRIGIIKEWSLAIKIEKSEIMSAKKKKSLLLQKRKTKS